MNEPVGLSERGAAVHASGTEALNDWRAASRERVSEPLEAVRDQIAKAHRRLATQAGLLDDASTSESLWPRLARYRLGVLTDVLGPLREGLTTIQPSATSTASAIELYARWESLADEQPREVEAPDPESLFVHSDGDTGSRATVKLLVRADRRLRRLPVVVGNGIREMIGRAPSAIPARCRSIPVRQLARYHLVERFGVPLVAEHDAIQRAVATDVAAFCAALGYWTEAILDLDEHLDRVEYHTPVDWKIAEGAGDDPATEEDLSAARDAAGALQEALERPATAWPAAVMPSGDALTADLEVGGTALLSMRHRSVSEGERSGASACGANGTLWTAWHQRARNDLDLDLLRVQLRSEMVRLEDECLQRVAHEVLDPVRETFATISTRLRSLAPGAVAACEAPGPALVSTLTRLEADGVRAITEQVRDLRGLASAEEALRAFGVGHQNAVDTLLASLPVELALADIRIRGGDVVPTTRGETVYPREEAIAAFSPPVGTLLERELDALRQRVLDVWDSTDRVVQVVQYNLDSAIDELRREGVAPTTPTDRAARARELAEGGFLRAAEALGEIASGLATPWQDLAKALFRVIQEDWIEFRRRLRPGDEGSDRWEDVRAALVRRVRRRWHNVLRRARAVRAWLAPRIAQEWNRVLALVSLGRTAVGVDRPTEQERLSTLDAVAAVRGKLQELPLVYRRLFAFEPVRRRRLLAGREGTLTGIMEFLSRWDAGNPSGILVLVGLPGVGRTSVLEVLDAELDRAGTTTHMVTFEGRVEGELDLTRRLGEAFDLPVDDLNALADALRARSRRTVCLVDGFERLFRQTLGGAQLAERALAFFRQTDDVVCWIVAASQVMWPIFQSQSRAAGRNLPTISLEPLDRDALERALLLRHQWSGLSLRFAEPAEIPSLLRRRLRRARTPEVRQGVLREMYFDRLTRAAQGDVGLAMLYWIRCADLTSEPGAVTMQPFAALSFRFLGGLNLPQTMTLRAFLVHGSLTVEEHQEIFRLDLAAHSIFLLERLLDLGLLEAEDATERGGATILTGVSYRLPAVVRPAVLSHLRHANMLPRSAA